MSQNQKRLFYVVFFDLCFLLPQWGSELKFVTMIAMKKFIIYFLLATLTLIVCGYSLLLIGKSRTFQFFGSIVSRIDTSERVVALTFDDGPEIYTNQVLDELAKKQVKATFYVVGNRLEAYPEIGKRIIEEGHELGNHSYSHQRFLLKPQSFIDHEIQTTNTLIRKAGYTGTIMFRPPNGKKLFDLPWYLSKHDIETIMWDVEPDTFATTTDALVQYALANTKPGSIILLHPSCKNCNSARAAITKIIDILTKQGYKFVTISELLSLRN